MHGAGVIDPGVRFVEVSAEGGANATTTAT
jgi:hypothetical protein